MPDAYRFPIARIGIIGGGQLGRMLVKAAKRLGCTCIVLDPTPASPAGQVAGAQIVGSYHDPDKLRELVEASDLTTVDIEDVDALTLLELEREGRTILPSPRLLAVVQDKLAQKRLLDDAGIATAPFIELVDTSPEHFHDFGYPLVQKARRGGYDGRGVVVMRGPEDYSKHLPVPSLIERRVDIHKEIAVLVARGRSGECRCYPPVEMCLRPEENVLDMLRAPGILEPAIAAAAEKLAVRTVETLDGVGIFGIEMFLSRDGTLVVNEVAPRTHNSGHHTIEANITNQFEQHLRALLGFPLGATDTLSPAVMVNLLGAAGYRGRPIIKGIENALAIPGVCLHLYGKAVTSPFRKMGHITVLDQSIDEAERKARQARDLIEIAGEIKL